jgi:hypothetical protein
MDWLLLLLNIFLALYSLYAWNKNSDREWLWLGVLGVCAVVLLSVRILFIQQLPETGRAILDVGRYLVWIMILGALVFIEIRKRRNPPKTL